MIAAQWEGRLAEVSASRDDAQASVEFLREERANSRRYMTPLSPSRDLVRDLEHDLVAETQQHGGARREHAEPSTLSHCAPRAGRPDGHAHAHERFLFGIRG